MAIKTIPLSRLKANLKATLDECADSGQAVVVQMPDQRLIAIQALDSGDDDALIDDLLAENPSFRTMLAKSKSSPRKPLTFKPGR
jgi:hypothetical protein